MRDRSDYVDEPIDEIRLKIQALADNELPPEEIDDVLGQIQGSYEYRSEYAELLRVKRVISGASVSVSSDWLAKAERKISRKVSRATGLLFLAVSYLLLVGYAVFTVFATPEVPMAILIVVGSLVLGVSVLLVGAIADRVRESRNDKYKEIIR